jgi:hypothetical protein
MSIIKIMWNYILKGSFKVMTTALLPKSLE